MQVTHPMQVQPNAIDAHHAPADGLTRTRYMLVVCVVCGQERMHPPSQQTSCPGCGANARRSFALFRDLREER
jgi:ribosomal protein S27E